MHWLDDDLAPPGARAEGWGEEASLQSRLPAPPWQVRPPQPRLTLHLSAKASSLCGDSPANPSQFYEVEGEQILHCPGSVLGKNQSKSQTSSTFLHR